MYAASAPPVVSSVVEPIAVVREVLVSVPTFEGKFVTAVTGVVHVGVRPIPAEVATCPRVPGEPASVREPALNSSATVFPVPEVADKVSAVEFLAPEVTEKIPAAIASPVASVFAALTTKPRALPPPDGECEVMVKQFTVPPVFVLV